MSNLWDWVLGLLKKLLPGGGGQTAIGSRNVQVDAKGAGSVVVHVNQAVEPPRPRDRSQKEWMILRAAEAHGGKLRLMIESMSGQRRYMGLPGDGALGLDIEAELQILREEGLIEREASSTSTIKYSLTGKGWHLVRDTKEP